MQDPSFKAPPTVVPGGTLVIKVSADLDKIFFFVPGRTLVAVPVIGENGVERIAEIALNDEDKAGFKKSVDAVHGLMAAAKTIAPDLA